VISQGADGKLQHYSTLGIIVMASMLVVIVMMYFINKQSVRKTAAAMNAPKPAKEVEAEAFMIE
jgi:hypothetical protein